MADPEITFVHSQERILSTISKYLVQLRNAKTDSDRNQSFWTLFQRSQQFVLAHAKQVVSVGCLSELDDVVQESFLKVFQATIPEECPSYRAWLARIITNTAIDLWRKEEDTEKRPPKSARRPSELLDKVISRESSNRHDPVVVDIGFVNAESPQEVWEFMGLLLKSDGKEFQQLAFMFFYEGLPCEEIQRRLGIAKATYGRKLNRIKARISLLEAVLQCREGSPFPTKN